MITGITVNSDKQQAYFEWNEANQLYANKESTVNLPALITSIKDHEELLLIFSYPVNMTFTARFGVRAHKGYNEDTASKGAVIVQDNPGKVALI